MNPCAAPPPELLAPAGDWDALRAAVANGADAVYFGLTDFNARFRAANFSTEELPEVLRFLHDRNVRGYVTFNTLVFSDELPRAVELLTAIAAAGADGVIVQDLGVVRLLRRLAPTLPLHGSTQMTLTEPRGVAFARRLGVARAIVARELSLPEIRRIREATDVPLEVFVHGALCIAYSGQCLTSEALGGRSANRGQCAQACRLPYALKVDGVPRDLGDKAYLLSPQDLAAHDRVGELAAAGVTGFKIEGRLKGAQYVAVAVRSYREALDAAAGGAPFVLPKPQAAELELSFSRGFSTGFLDGVNHQVLVQGRFPKSRGLRVGTVTGKTARGVIVALENGAAQAVPLKPGDGVVFDEGHPEQDEQGGRIAAVNPGWERPPVATPGDRGQRPLPPRARRRSATEYRGRRTEDKTGVEILFHRGDIHLPAVAVGSLVWKTDDPAVRRKWEQTFARDRVARPERLDVRVDAPLGGPLVLRARDAAGREAEARWDGPLAPAEKHPLTLDLVRAQLGRLGGTPFALGDVAADRLDSVMVPKSVLNDLRRRVVDDLTRRRRSEAGHAIAEPGALERMRIEIRGGSGLPPATSGGRGQKAPPTREGPSHLYVLCRTLDQLDAVLAWAPEPPLARPAMAYCDFEDIRRYRDAVDRGRAAGMPIGLATLRIVKPGEEGLLRQIAECGPDAVLVRNLAALSFYREHAPRLPLVGDYALNAANELTADLLAGEGLARLVPSYDLTWEQLAAMLGRIDPGLFEVVVHQRIPMFHMEHCVYAATLSDGKDFRDCGRPCDAHRIDLQDRMGAEHPVGVDVGCRNTVYNATAQSAAELVPAMRARGLAHFRVELLRETPEESMRLVETYARVLAGLEDGKATWRRLRAVSRLGVTRGTFAV